MQGGEGAGHEGDAAVSGEVIRKATMLLCGEGISLGICSFFMGYMSLFICVACIMRDCRGFGGVCLSLYPPLRWSVPEFVSSSAVEYGQSM